MSLDAVRDRPEHRQIAAPGAADAGALPMDPAVAFTRMLVEFVAMLVHIPAPARIARR
ncbi:hypothetical protein [Pseudoxanthomonas suwonensis]|uniref:hypothetical protein n=1 Tax=Pseudoxanthomonas suwonensis TaxID=314722 RepID=UPI000AEC5804|nr:hypothetical protein [Pseudoxanthomonas suwonensis]